MAQATHSFPDSFLFGAATSGFQVEGNSTQTDFWQWEQQPGRIAQGQRSGNACEWWEAGRWREDFDRAANDGHNTHRLSVEWSRVEPSAGRWDEAALDHYRDMVRGLRERGLAPLVTLHHFVNPLWLAERNAWETSEAIALFARYVDKVVRALGEYVDFWATLNEPNIYMYFGWINGIFPPGKKSLFLATQVAGNLLRAHAAAYRAIHSVQPHARVGLPIHFRPIAPAQPNFAPDVWVARTQFNLFSSLFSDALRSGRLRQLLRPAISIPEAKGTQDYIGLNYYSADVARFDITNPMELFGRRSFPEGAEDDGSGLYASHPPGLFESLKWAHQLKLPIYITENGIGGEEDGLRRRYLISHLRQAWRAVNFNWDVRGYFHWSLLDNFEWERGWTHRFGLYALDTETQIRTPRLSARLYAEVCRTRTLSSEMVSRFAPELLETLFPG